MSSLSIIDDTERQRFWQRIAYEPVCMRRKL